MLPEFTKSTVSEVYLIRKVPRVLGIFNLPENTTTESIRV